MNRELRTHLLPRHGASGVFAAWRRRGATARAFTGCLAGLLSLFLTVGIALAAQAAATTVPGPRLVISGDPGTEGAVRQLRGIAPERFAGALTLTGLDDPGLPIRVRVAAENTALARRTPRWVAGFANGRRSSIVVFPARASRYPYDSLEELMQHEVAHVYIDRAAAGAEVPRWLHEGIAMTAGERWGLEDRGRFAVDVALAGEVPLADLDRLFQGDGVRRAYAVAGGFTQHLMRRHGPGVTGDLLAGLARGDGIETAFRRATGETLAAAEASFWQSQTFWNRWVPLLTSSAVVWTGVALLALVAYRRRQERAAELMERWDKEEAPPPRWSPHGEGRTGASEPPATDSGASDSPRRDWMH